MVLDTAYSAITDLGFILQFSYSIEFGFFFFQMQTIKLYILCSSVSSLRKYYGIHMLDLIQIHYNSNVVCVAIKMSMYLAHVPGILNLTAIEIKALLLNMFSQGMFFFLSNIPFHSEEGSILELQSDKCL